jgi:hypothetical protein
MAPILLAAGLTGLLACTSPTADRSESTPDSEAEGEPQDTAPWEAPWPTLRRSPAWTSHEEGVGTGGGFADMDGDGDADLVVSYGNDIQRGPLAVYLNEGGSLAEDASWTSRGAHYHGHLSLGDLNGDGWTDVAVSRFLGDGGWEEPGGVDVYLNQGGQLEDEPSWSSPEAFYSFSCALGDVDQDGDLDLAAVSGEPYYHQPERSHVYLNDGTGDLGSSAWTTEQDRHSLDVLWTDIDADGDLDLAMANIGTGHTVYLNRDGELDRSPAWTAPGEPTRFEGNTLDYGDVNDDGHMDLVVSDNDQLGGAGTVVLYCGPDLEACWESQDPPRYQSAVSLEDVDGDGDLDLTSGAWGRGSLGAEVQIYLNDLGMFEDTPSWTSQTSSVIEAFAWADLDGSDAAIEQVSGVGLLQVPHRGRVLSVTGGVASDGWISGPGSFEAQVLAPAPRDLAVTNWDKYLGNHVFTRSD